MAIQRIAVELPAATTVETGNLSRETRNDIKKGIKCIWLMALRALFEVSLIVLSQRTRNDTEVLTKGTTG